MGIGKQTTPRAFVNACDVFVYTENLVPADEKPLPDAAPAVEPQGGLEQLFRNAFEAAAQDNGWASLSAIGNKLRQLDPAFDPRTYGYRQLLHLVQDHAELFEIRRKKVTGGAVVYVRLREDQ
jgi:hypothetical protein